MKLVVVGLLALCVTAIHSEPLVRLCGREFARAVYFSCGAARWKRHPVDTSSKGLIDADGNSIKESKSRSNELNQYNMESEKASRIVKLKSVHKRNVEDLKIICCTIGCTADDIHSMC